MSVTTASKKITTSATTNGKHIERTINEMQPKQDLFEIVQSKDHEEVVLCSDKATGLKAIIAIHTTTLGPALGGCRMWTYASDYDALNDVIR